METKLDFDDVLIVPKRTKTASRKDVSLERTFRFYHSPRVWIGVPIIAANMGCTGTFAMAEALSEYRMITCLHKHYSVDEIVDFVEKHSSKNMVPYTFMKRKYAWISIGRSEEDRYKLADIINKSSLDRGNNAPNICIDVANGYTDTFVEYCASIRKDYPQSIIMAGNVATPNMASELILHGGVDIVKIGIGPGSACTTRLVTGIGYPQLSAIQECVDVHGLKSEDKRLGLQCADGGCKTPGDICKAFAANSDFVMLGGIFAGTDECEGEWQTFGGTKYSYVDPNTRRQLFSEGMQMGIGMLDGLTHVCTYDKEKDGTWEVEPSKQSLKFYGMSSEHAQDKHGDGLRDYRASEGRVIEVPYKGPVDGIVKQILGGLRSCCTYVGATCLKDLPKCASFVKVNRPHNNMDYDWMGSVK